MEVDQVIKKKELLKKTIEELDEKTIDQLLAILHRKKRTP